MAVKKTKVEVYGETSKYERSMRTVKRTSKSTSDSISSHWSKTFGTLTKLSVAFGVAGAASFYALQKVGTKAVTLAMEQEKAQIALGAALRANNEYTEDLMHQYTGFASSIQAVTTYGDEQILKLMALQKNLGVTSDRLEDATRASIGLAAATGRDVESMAMYIALAEQGEFTMLRRYIPALRSTTDKTEQLRIITEFAARGFLVAQENAQTFSGGLEQLKNLYGDVFERIGDVVVKNEVLLALMGEGKQTLLEWAEYIERWVNANDKLIAQKTHEAINKIQSSVKSIVNTFNALPEGIVGVAGYGLIGSMLFGRKAGATIAAMALVAKLTSKMAYPIPPGTAKEQAKERLENELRLAEDIHRVMSLQAGIEKETLRISQQKIDTLKQRIQLLDAITPPTSKRLKLHVGAPGIIPAPMGEPSLAPLESYDKITKELLGASTLRGEQMLELDMIQAELLAEQMMEMDTQKLEEKSQLETYMAGLLYNDLEAMGWQHQATMAQQAEKEKAVLMTKLGIYQSVAAGVANTFLQIAQAGGKQSKQAFKMYQAFSIVQAGMATAMAIIKTLAEPLLIWPSNVIMAGIIGAMGAVQIGMIASAKPPSYDRGGISTTPGMYYAGVPEAHVPLKGGAIPVDFNAGRGGGDVFIVMENPVFQDLETQQAVFANIAANITERIAPNAVYRAYDNDHPIRGLIRSRA